MLNIVIQWLAQAVGLRSKDIGIQNQSLFMVRQVKVVMDNLRPSMPHRFIFICQKSHLSEYDTAKLSVGHPGARLEY